MIRALTALALVLSLVVPTPQALAQQAEDPPTDDIPSQSADAPECVPGHVGTQPVHLCLCADGRAIAWRQGSTEPVRPCAAGLLVLGARRA
jgi:hypothetical protein